MRRSAGTGPIFAPPPRQAIYEVVVRLPMPPSVNALHQHGGRNGPRRSDAYRTWITAAGWRLQQQRPGRIVGRYTIRLAMPEASKADLGNLEKAVSDLLQAHGVIENDRRAKEIRLCWQDSDPEAIVTVRSADAHPATAAPCAPVPQPDKAEAVA